MSTDTRFEDRLQSWIQAQPEYDELLKAIAAGESYARLLERGTVMHLPKSRVNALVALYRDASNPRVLELAAQYEVRERVREEAERALIKAEKLEFSAKTRAEEDRYSREGGEARARLQGASHRAAEARVALDNVEAARAAGFNVELPALK